MRSLPEGSGLQDFLNRVFRCHHRHKTYPFTPRGEEQCYAVCLDCGQRLVSDPQVIRSEAPLQGDTRPDEVPAPKKKSRDKRARERRRSGRERAESVLNAPPLRHSGVQSSRHDLLWVGLCAFFCSGGLYYSAAIRQEPKHPIAPMPVQQEIPNAADKSPVASAVKSTPLETGRRNQMPRLEGKSSVVVLGLDAQVAIELSKHPGRLDAFIQNGSLFTVPRGTAIKVRESQNGVIRILILEGSMAGREGWAQASQVSSR